MSRLEIAAKPLLAPALQGQTISIDSESARTLTDWITLKMMVWESVDQRSTVFTRDQTLAFSHRRDLPDNILVWLLRSEEPYLSTRIIRAYTGLFEKLEVPFHQREVANTQTVLFGIGQFLIFFVHSQLSNFDPWEFSQDNAVRLWPFGGETAVWPPVNRIGIAEARYIADSLGRYVSRPGMTPI